MALSSQAVLAGGVVALCLSAVTATGQEPIALSLPVDCVMGEACFVQQTPDRAPGPDVADFRCGIAAYDGHTGVDIRLVSLADIEADVAVLAAAPGVVLRARDGMADALVETAQERRAVENRECGNGLIVDHGDGWQTQYCHLKQGSVLVRPGDEVARGQPIGAIGSSGMSQFPHLELVVRRDGVKLDPFTGEPLSAPCGGGEDAALWDADAQLALGGGSLEGAPIALGFADGPVELDALMRAAPPPPVRTSSALVGYALVANPRKGDVLSMSIDGPNGFRAQSDATVPRSRAQQMNFVGKRLREAAWPAGEYVLRLRVVRDDQILSIAELRLDLQ